VRINRHKNEESPNYFDEPYFAGVCFTMTQENLQPAQTQPEQPGTESPMRPEPESKAVGYLAAGKLKGKKAIITGGDSGIGRSVAVMFAKEGADVVITYLDEHEDAQKTRELVEQEHRECVLISGDIGESGFCNDVIRQTTDRFGTIDILVNNAAEQHPIEKPEEITDEQLLRTFKTNIFSFFYMARAALPHMKEHARIVNSASVTAYRGSSDLLDYTATKGAIVAFTRALALFLIDRKINVNAVAPGPVWTPLIPSSFEEDKVASFGSTAPMKRPGQPDEIAPCYVFLASDDASYMTGQVLHPNGGWIVNT
jgi:NAD(P)-dependent dehydrogenase (short-subunit alcohol dehydrogenase family)